jgi:hypothetical protein
MVELEDGLNAVAGGADLLDFEGKSFEFGWEDEIEFDILLFECRQVVDQIIVPALAGEDVFRVGDRTSFLLAASLLLEDDVLTLFVAQSFTVSAEMVFEDIGGHGYIPRIVGFHGGDHLAGGADVFS